MSNIALLPVQRINAGFQSGEDWSAAFAFYLADGVTAISLAGIAFTATLTSLASGEATAVPSGDVNIIGGSSNILSILIPYAVTQGLDLGAYAFQVLGDGGDGRHFLFSGAELTIGATAPMTVSTIVGAGGTSASLLSAFPPALLADITSITTAAIVSALEAATSGQLGALATALLSNAPSASVGATLLTAGAAATNLGFTPLNPSNDLAELEGTAAAARANLGVPGLTGSLIEGNILVGDSTGSGVQDGGVQQMRSNNDSRNPGTADDIDAGYGIGSIFVNNTSQVVFICTSNVANAAVWAQMNAAVSASYETISYAVASLAAGSTTDTAPGAQGVNFNYEALAQRAVTLSNLSFRLSAAPGAGQSVTATVWSGTSGLLTATSLSCSVSGAFVNNAGLTATPDTTHTVLVPAGQSWAVQFVVSGSATATGEIDVGLVGLS